MGAGAGPAVNEAAGRLLPEETRPVLRAFLAEAAEIFGPSLEAVILYGSAARGEYLPGRSNLNLLLLVAAHEVGRLQRYAKAHKRWSRERIVVPLLLTRTELEALPSLFPLECLDLVEHHLLLAGDDPFTALSPDLRRLPEQCEREVRANLLRTRQRFVEGGGTAEAALILIPLSVTSLLCCLRGLARLLDRAPAKTSDDLLDGLQDAVGLDLAPIRDALRLKRGQLTPGQCEAPRLFDRYCGALQALAERVARLRAEGRLGRSGAGT
jgi:predicted nucleotidyltransferase